MKRNGFTMVELIFVIIIIGILSVAAIPKFGDIKDRAKVNAEYSSLSGLDSAAIAKMEFHKEDNPDGSVLIDWHNNIATTKDLETTAKMSAYYTTDVNGKNRVLKEIIKKGDDFKIVAYADAGDPGAAGAKGVDDIIFIKGAASNSTTGVKKEVDVKGKPDKNDVWVFNGSAYSATISYYDADSSSAIEKIIESGELSLIDITNAHTAAAAETATTFQAAGGDADSTHVISIKSAVTITPASAGVLRHANTAAVLAITEI